MGKFNVDTTEIRKCLICIKNFRQLGPLEIAVVKYIVQKLFTDKQKDEYRKYFYWINTKSDGMLSREELLKSYWSSGF